MVLSKDLNDISKDILENGYKDSSILITGSTGLLGSLIAKGFLLANKEYGLNNKIYVLARNVDKAKIVFCDYLIDKNFQIIKNEITEKIDVENDIDYIFHTACVTASKEMVEKPVELIKGAVGGTINILDFAKEHGTKGVVFLSSMETYGVVDASTRRLKEGDFGPLDLTSVRSGYPESKRMCECICKCYAEEYGVNISTARLTQTFGAGVDLSVDNRLFAIISKSVISNSDIVLSTSGKSSRDYCYTTDAISAILLLGKKGVAGEVYNVANESTNISVIEMARMVAKEFGNGINVVVKQGSDDYVKRFSPPAIIKLDTTKIRDLGWKPKVGLTEMYDRLIKYGKESGMQKVRR